MLNFLEKILGLKKENKWIIIEYTCGFILAFSLWGYHLINTGIISQNIAKKCIIYFKLIQDDFQLSGLTDSYFGTKRVLI